MRAGLPSTLDQKPNSRSQFIWVSKGGGRARIDGTTRGFGASTAIFIPHMTLHGIEFTPASQGWIVSVSPACAIELPEQPALSSVTALSDQSQLSYLFDAIDREGRSERKFTNRALDCHLGLLSVWFLRHDEGTGRRLLPQDSARRRLMRRFVKLLDERYADKNSVADYAGALSVTTTHLSRVCRQTTGKPASTLIQDRVLEVARSQLSGSDQRVSEIAANLGFGNAAYFSRLFTQKTGRSPSNYRQQARS